ncbi:MAG TPA: PmoA family protein [Candidatus Hydrogenedentes bacterium]|nr:PmoA family protein [Candidatus Hydrogenedentota bacterium]HPG67917.1 PmoA family protein [Candidatus Hydrogenedentota bacterium]
MLRVYGILGLLVLACAMVAYGELTIEDDQAKTLTILEDGQKVLSYNYGRIDPPPDSEADKERYWRESYVHPLYGLDGEIMTQDFPPDHFHHRGVFWTWPGCKVGDRPMDLWSVDGARHRFQGWIAREAGVDKAEMCARNAWMFDDDPEPKVEEIVGITVFPADEKGRAIDFRLVLKNICHERVLIQGQDTPDSITKSAKGYGGFCYRPDATRRPFVFCSAGGIQNRDVLELDTPWADCSFHALPDGEGSVSGVAIFQHPANPGYPHKGWILRKYGFLGASWPHVEGYPLEPGASVELQYRLYVHRGDAAEGKVETAFKAYTESAK